MRTYTVLPHTILMFEGFLWCNLFSKSCTVPLGEVTKVLMVPVGEIYPFIQLGWTGAVNKSKVPCSKKQQ